MDAYEQGLEAIAKIEDAELKANLETSFKTLNQDKGKAKGDITKIKLENEDLKNKFKDSEGNASKYKDVMRVFSEAGIKAEDAAKLAEKLKVDKTKEDENAELKRLLEEKDAKVKKFESKEELSQFKSKMDPILDKALEELKDKDGNKIKLAKSFINREELYKSLDLNSDVLVNDRLTKVLEAAVMDQQKFFNDNGVDFSKDVHKVNPKGDNHFGGNPGIDLNKINENSVKAGGSIDVIAQGMAAIRAAREKEKG